MHCPFCQEEIQADAIVCRFCNAEQIDGNWIRSSEIQHADIQARNKGRFTIRTAAVFFFISVLFELFSLTSEVPILGKLYGGWMAIVYHTIYGSLFGAMGIGLWTGKPWGLRVMLLGTIIYSVEKCCYLFDKEGRLTELQQIRDELGEFAEFIEPEMLLQATNLAILLILGCWWGFMAYLYLRRDYFASSQTVQKH